MACARRCIGSVVGSLAIFFFASLAHAAPGPACTDAPCIDADGDGFPSCDCSAAPCDCDDANAARFPGAPESCDSAVDFNCNSATFEGCGDADGCHASVCVPRCIPLDDFGCPGGSFFSNAGDSGTCLCIPTDCTVFGCAPGSTCDDSKVCVPNCSPGVRCPFGQTCRGDGCVDPCANVQCPAGSACIDGVCAQACDCNGALPCPNGQTCDSARSKCVETACIGVNCAPSTHCAGGVCVDDCVNVVCPPKRVCTNGACTDLCSPDPCTPGFGCDWRTGACNPLPIADGGLVANPSDPEEIERLRIIGGGFACSTTPSSRVFLGALAAFVLVFAARVGRRLKR